MDLFFLFVAFRTAGNVNVLFPRAARKKVCVQVASYGNFFMTHGTGALDSRLGNGIAVRAAVNRAG